MSPANLLRAHSVPSSSLLINMLNKTVPLGNTLATGLQLDPALLITTTMIFESTAYFGADHKLQRVIKDIV